MAIDIQKAITSNNIKNGTLLTMCQITGEYITNNNAVNNLPSITDIEDKYDNRFDDPSYYYGIGGATLIGG